MRYHNQKSEKKEVILDTDKLFPLLTRVQLVALRAEIEIEIIKKS
jgi:hypothetical protein